MLVFVTDIHALGLPIAQGLIFTETFYWDMNDQTRAFAKRFAERDKGIHPTMIHAGVYAALLHYFKAVEALKSDDGTKVIAKMKETPTDDPLFGKGTIRVDGRKLHPAYLVEVKKPAESKGPWDYYKIRTTIPADQAFRPLADGGCPLVK
jgi:branched-chain amino acid transport system substrate-binding protein